MAQSGSSHIGEVEGEIHQDRVIACSILVMIVNGGTGNAMKNTILCAANVFVQVKRSISVLFTIFSVIYFETSHDKRESCPPKVEVVIFEGFQKIS